MKRSLLIVLGILVSVLLAGCPNQAKQAEKEKADAEAKARAEAAKKEMETLPKAFQTPDYLKKNEPAAGSASKSDTKK